jgi:N-acetylmuramoyl-L-alanine amidase
MGPAGHAVESDRQRRVPVCFVFFARVEGIRIRDTRMKLTGKCSHFGGPADTGVSSSEDLAWWETWDQVVDDGAENLFLPQQPPGTTGLARRLDPTKFYLACRWDYDQFPKSYLASGEHLALVRNEAGVQMVARPVDFGPHTDTGRITDLSPALATALSLATDDEVTVIFPFEGDEEMAIHRVCISAGHGKNIPGCSGVDGMQEHEETPKVMRAVGAELRKRGVTALVFWDQTSTTVEQNLDTIVDWHNANDRQLDVSCHFNASDGNGHGVEVIYVTQEELAAKVSAAIAAAGPLTDRGAKYDERGLAFLRNTDKPAILIETCFLDNEGDVRVYQDRFDAICAAIAGAIAGAPGLPVQPPPGRPERPGWPVGVALTIPDGVTLRLTINGENVLLD